MLRDYKAIGKRIEKLGITQRQVAKCCEMAFETLNRIIKGDPKYLTNKDKIELIHEFLDLVKTRFVKKNGKWVEIK